MACPANNAASAIAIATTTSLSPNSPPKEEVASVAAPTPATNTSASATRTGAALCKPTLAQYPMSQNAASSVGSFHDPRPAGGIPSNPFNSSGFVTNTYDPAAGMRYSGFADLSHQPSTASSIAEWQQNVPWPSAPTYPPLPSLHGQEDASPALNPRINWPR
ncbi:hypothetical protein CBOM_03361 [Ceraceosorus bombacis]|uniref:Uncharacterized protein n=1 Tax=Ceraceosorus bombacis TaxID=401625 RepID=A0A0P1BLN0_9BASI|nr:hypothetical protein CBOM_03361 [Ceraceosorus bombacis]